MNAERRNKSLHARLSTSIEIYAYTSFYECGLFKCIHDVS